MPLLPCGSLEKQRSLFLPAGSASFNLERGMTRGTKAQGGEGSCQRTHEGGRWDQAYYVPRSKWSTETKTYRFLRGRVAQGGTGRHWERPREPGKAGPRLPPGGPAPSQDPPSTGLPVPVPLSPPPLPLHPGSLPPAAGQTPIGHSPRAVSESKIREPATFPRPFWASRLPDRAQPPLGQQSPAQSGGYRAGQREGLALAPGSHSGRRRVGRPRTCSWAPASCSSKVVTRSRAARSRSRTCPR